MTESDHPESLLDLLTAQVRSSPEDVACVDGSETIDYAELARRVTVLSRGLAGVSVAPGATVAILMTPSIGMVVGAWAILHAGAGYLPLAVNYPTERLLHMIRDSAVDIVVTDSVTDGLAHRILPSEIRIVSVDALATAGEPAAWQAPGRHSGTDAAYTIYTSGTTGTPKGVVIPHRAIVNQLHWLQDELALDDHARILLKTPVGFDAAQWELLANACGATVVVAPAGTHTRPADILDLVDREDISILQCVPTVWQELAAHPDLRRARRLRTAVSGGEALPTTLGRTLRARLPGTRMVNLYGPTETAINATWFDFTRGDWDTATVPIGIAVDGCELVVVETDGALTPVGDTGELLIAGTQLASGYRGRPDVTEARFPTLAIGDRSPRRFYRTGDLVRHRADGTLEFVGRNDEQVKVNGHRIETNEVRVAIETHEWVRAAAVVPWVSEHGSTQLAGFVELDPEQAPLMDQDLAGRHHRSKATHTQVTAQLGNLAARVFGDGTPTVALPGSAAEPHQIREVFARKTYRSFTGAPVSLQTICELLGRAGTRRSPEAVAEPLAAEALGRLLRWLGPFESPDRLLPKYSYASPGALNATQVYVETLGVPGLPDGVHYFDPVHHTLHRVGTAARRGVHLHLVGLPAVIESVYATNVHEVLHFEAGHILGLLDRVAARSGWAPVLHGVDGPVDGVPADGLRTASIQLTAPDAADGPIPARSPATFVQIHGDVTGVRPGLYRFTGDTLEFVTTGRIERRHVIAINQGTYAHSSFGIVLALRADAGWPGFVELGRALAHLQQEGVGLNLGLMSAGYSSLTGRDLPTARRFRELVDDAGVGALSYFALGGPVTDAQLSATGMAEDVVHMKGPEELLKDALRETLPAAMVPPTIHVVDRIPQSQHGKQDRSALVRLAGELNTRAHRTADPPARGTEARVAEIWSRVLGYEPVYRSDDFFAQGGNSMSALRLIRAIHDELQIVLPVQTIFTAPTVAQLATQLSAAPQVGLRSPRVHRLAGTGTSGTTLIWPGLGGYPMSLRTLAAELAQDGHTVYGLQARGLNAGEQPPTTLAELVTADLQAVLDLGAPEPFRVVGYSFGARVAAEVGRKLVAHGHVVEQVVLIAPGSPVLPAIGGRTDEVDYRNAYFKRILASVFSGRTDPPYADRLDALHDRDAFVDLIVAAQPEFARDVVARIVAVVEQTYRMREEPVGVEPGFLDHSVYLRARGDGPSFADIPVAPLGFRTAPVSNLPYHHYDIISEGALDIASAVLERSMEGELV